MGYRYSLSAMRAMFDQETGDFPIVLFTITHPNLSEPILISTDATQRIESLTTDRQIIYGTISNGKEYLYFPVTVTLPEDTEGTPPNSKLTFENVSQDITKIIREMSESPSVKMTIIMASTPDVIEAEFDGFRFSSVEMNESQITGTLTINSLTNEVFPMHTMTPAFTPGLFA